jgi:hypothetical protein
MKREGGFAEFQSTQLTAIFIFAPAGVSRAIPQDRDESGK